MPKSNLWKKGSVANVRFKEDENFFISDTSIWYAIMQLMYCLWSGIA